MLQRGFGFVGNFSLHAVQLYTTKYNKTIKSNSVSLYRFVPLCTQKADKNGQAKASRMPTLILQICFPINLWCCFHDAATVSARRCLHTGYFGGNRICRACWRVGKTWAPSRDARPNPTAAIAHFGVAQPKRHRPAILGTRAFDNVTHISGNNSRVSCTVRNCVIASPIANLYANRIDDIRSVFIV
jgi:hypothetical protein